MPSRLTFIIESVTWRKARGLKSADLSNRRLGLIVSAAALLPAAYFILRPVLPDMLRQSGTAIMYLVAVAGALLLLSSLSFVMAKRRDVAAPKKMLTAHVLAASFGTAFVLIHSTGSITRIPFLLVLTLLALAALGIWARTRAAGRMSATFGRKHRGFATADPTVTQQLRKIIEAKTEILRALDPAASEATFSVAPAHWRRHPRLAWAYWKLAREEEALISARQSVGAAQAWWRPLHMTLAALFVIGLIIHILTVTFFAGYVAEGREIYWWHLTAW